MKRSVIALLLSLTFCSAASAAGAKGGTVAPPGNSSVSQYVESIPTAKGNRPTGSIGAGGAGGGPGNSAGSGSATAASGALTSHDRQALARQGTLGRQTAAFAIATGVTRAATGSGEPTAGGGTTQHSTGGGDNSSSPTSSVLTAMVGGGAQGGLGPLLLLILILIALAPGLLVLRKRRGQD